MYLRCRFDALSLHSRCAFNVLLMWVGYLSDVGNGTDELSGCAGGDEQENDDHHQQEHVHGRPRGRAWPPQQGSLVSVWRFRQDVKPLCRNGSRFWGGGRRRQERPPMSKMERCPGGEAGKCRP